VLEAVKLRPNPGLFSTANCTDYKPKNRSPAVLPMDGYITFITPTEQDSNIYINAVYVSSWDNDKEYIATQLPLTDTTNDFWRLIRDERCIVIVMLNSPTDLTNSQQQQYWPYDGKTLRSGQIDIVNVGEIDGDDIQITDLKVMWSGKKLGNRAHHHGDQYRHGDSTTMAGRTSHDQQQHQQNSPRVSTRPTATAAAPAACKTFNVRHLRLLNWTEDTPVPGDKTALLDLCEQVSLCLEKSSHEEGGRVLVHCLLGAERTGLFCALLNIINHIRSEKEVDVFNAVKLVRRSRPEFITSLDQYRYLYELAAAFLASDVKSTSATC
jgi:protein tyrosine phosphatase